MKKEYVMKLNPKDYNLFKQNKMDIGLSAHCENTLGSF